MLHLDMFCIYKKYHGQRVFCAVLVHLSHQFLIQNSDKLSGIDQKFNLEFIAIEILNVFSSFLSRIVRTFANFF